MLENELDAIITEGLFADEFKIDGVAVTIGDGILIHYDHAVDAARYMGQHIQIDDSVQDRIDKLEKKLKQLEKAHNRSKWGK